MKDSTKSGLRLAATMGVPLGATAGGMTAVLSGDAELAAIIGVTSLSLPFTFQAAESIGEKIFEMTSLAQTKNEMTRADYLARFQSTALMSFILPYVAAGASAAVLAPAQTVLAVSFAAAAAPTALCGLAYLGHESAKRIGNFFTRQPS